MSVSHNNQMDAPLHSSMHIKCKDLFNGMYAASIYLSGSHKPITYVIKTYINYMIPTNHLLLD